MPHIGPILLKSATPSFVESPLVSEKQVNNDVKYTLFSFYAPSEQTALHRPLINVPKHYSVLKTLNWSRMNEHKVDVSGL